MALGRPVINIPRTNLDLRAVAAALDAVNQRIKAIEDAINKMPEQNVSILANTLFKSDDGLVVKRGNNLVTRVITSNGGVTIEHGDGQRGNILISAP